MENYIMALLMYIVLGIAFKLFMNFKDKRNGTKKANTQQGRNDYCIPNEIKGHPIQRSRPIISSANEYEAYSIEEFNGDVYEMPFDLWVAKVEHDTFVEYMRHNLETQGILMDDIDI